MWKRLESFFTINKAEKTGIIVLITLTLCVWFGLRAVEFFVTPAPKPGAIDSSEISEYLVEQKSENTTDAASLHEQKSTDSLRPEKTKKFERPSFTVDINNADSIGFERLYGIGPVLAKRIVHFREALGGFYSVDQIREVYGLPDSTFQNIKGQLSIGKTELRQIGVNTATEEQLSKHPYLNKKQAKAICGYRKTKGPYTTIDELTKADPSIENTFPKIKPYLKMN